MQIRPLPGPRSLVAVLCSDSVEAELSRINTRQAQFLADLYQALGGWWE